MLHARAEAPWTAGELLGAVGANVAALVVLIVAFAGSANTDTLNGQVGWLNVAVVGLTLGLGGDAALFFAARRAVGRRRIRLRPDIVVTATITELGKEGPWVWLPGTVRAHRPGCAMVLGKPALPADAAVIRAHRLRRCEVCEC